MRLTAFLTLLVSVPLFAGERFRVVPLFTISDPPPPFAAPAQADVVFLDGFGYFGTDGGLFRAALPLGTVPPERIAFEWTPVTDLAAGDGLLYATLDCGRPTGPGAATRSLLQSADGGLSWLPLDHQLEECLGGRCAPLVASQIDVIGGRIFVNAGGNVLVSGNEGASWTILQGASDSGKPQQQACYDPAFAVIGARLLMGGECPLDIAYLRSGTLRADGLEWEQAPVAAETPFLENRNVQFIRSRGDSDVVYAGVEGALLQSVDAGALYDFVLHYALDATKYPYITHILFPSTRPSTIVIAGFDKANGGPYLAVSSDNGATWRDESPLLPGSGSESWFVSSLAETPSGQIVIGVEDDATGSLYVSELRPVAARRRRAARH